MPGGKAAAPAVNVPQPPGAPKLEEDSPFALAMQQMAPYATWALRIGSGAAALSGLYLIYVLFMGGAAHATDPSAAQLSNLSLAAAVLNWALVVIALAAIVSAFDVTAVGLGVAALGVGLHFGAPFLLFSLAQSKAIGTVADAFRQGGFVLVVVGLLKYAVDLALWAMGSPERNRKKASVGLAQRAEPAQQRVASEANMFSPCWKLPFCREVIRRQCPAFIARKRCWKFGRGCYCDEEMISRIIRGESMEAISAPTKRSREGKPPCDRCYIYIEHQAHKFRAMSPLAIPATIIGMFLIWPLYDRTFTKLLSGLDTIWVHIGFHPADLTPDAVKTNVPGAHDVGQLTPEQVAHFAVVLFGVVLGFMMLIYISKFIEWAIFKAKW